VTSASARAVALGWMMTWAVPSGAAHAQQVTASLETGVVSVRFAEQARFSAVTLSPTVRLRTAHSSSGLSGTLSQVGAAGWSQQGTLYSSLFTGVSARGFLGEGSVAVGGSRFPDGLATSQAIGSARLHWLGAVAGAWVGGGGGTMFDGVAHRGVRQLELGLSARRELLGATLLATPTVTDDTLRYTDLLAALTVSRGPFDLSASLGGRAGATLPIVGGDQRVWGNAALTVWLAPRTALTAGAGTYPVDLTQGFPAGQYVSAGLRLGATRRADVDAAVARRAARRAARGVGVAALVAERIDDATVELRVKAPGAQRVEIQGDPTGWAPMLLTPTRGGWWVGRVSVTRVTFELVLRVDGGAWLVPPDAEPVTDEFGGQSGRVSVP
jgi:hypothetical protein